MYARAISMSCDRRMYALSRPVARAAERDRDVTGCGKNPVPQLHQSLFGAQPEYTQASSVRNIVRMRA